MSSPPMKQSPLVAGSPTAARSPVKSPGEIPRTKKESQVAKLQRQASKDSTGPRLRTVSSGSSIRARTDSTASGVRRPSLSLGHSNSIPFHLGIPSAEEIDIEKGKADQKCMSLF